MPYTDSLSNDVFGYLLCLLIALAMLVILVFIVLPGCADPAVTGSGAARCKTGSALYLSGAVFAASGVYAGSKICRLLFPARFG